MMKCCLALSLRERSREAPTATPPATRRGRGQRAPSRYRAGRLSCTHGVASGRRALAGAAGSVLSGQTGDRDRDGGGAGQGDVPCRLAFGELVQKTHFRKCNRAFQLPRPPCAVVNFPAIYSDSRFGDPRAVRRIRSDAADRRSRPSVSPRSRIRTGYPRGTKPAGDRVVPPHRAPHDDRERVARIARGSPCSDVLCVGGICMGDKKNSPIAYP